MGSTFPPDKTIATVRPFGSCPGQESCERYGASRLDNELQLSEGVSDGFADIVSLTTMPPANRSLFMANVNSPGSGMRRASQIER